MLTLGAVLGACGLKGPLALPEQGNGNVVIRGPGTTLPSQNPGGTGDPVAPAPEATAPQTAPPPGEAPR